MTFLRLSGEIEIDPHDLRNQGDMGREETRTYASDSYCSIHMN